MRRIEETLMDTQVYVDKKRIPYRSFYPTPVNFTSAGRKAGRTRKAKLAKLIPAYLFFRAHAGGRIGFNAQTALDLARAEQHARCEGWQWEWMNDRCIGGDCRETETCEHPCCQGTEHVCESLTLWDSEGRSVLASLGSICEPTTEYRRVVKAELAMEAMSEGR
jgi:hypothetical protein